MHAPTVLCAIVLAVAEQLLSTAIADVTADPARLSQHVKTLSCDAFEGRGPATPGEQKAVAYIAEQMKAAGLQPGGDLKDGKRAWTQDVPLAQFDISGPVDVSATAQGQRRPLAQGKDIAIRAAATNIDRVQFSDVPVVFLGYGVDHAAGCQRNPSSVRLVQRQALLRQMRRWTGLSPREIRRAELVADLTA
jgi:hypothetical protein